MALSQELHDIAANLLRNVPRSDLAELIRVLQYFNSKCREDARAACFEHGCQTPGTDEERHRQVIVEKRGSQDFYMMAPRPTCKCCGR